MTRHPDDPAGNPRESGRIPCLDGLRAVSICLVLLGHAIGTRGLDLDPRIETTFDLANLGVRVFFVISGFLITSLLLQEHARHGGISLRQFYFRRTLRIFPAFYVYLGAMLVADALGWIGLRDGDAAYAATYTINYHAERAWQVGHLWSLAVEEQFYLIWPAVLLALGLRRGLWAAAAWLAIAPVLRVVLYFYVPEARPGLDENFLTVADALAAGCVLAALRPWLGCQRWYLALQRAPVFLCVPVAILVAKYTRDHVAVAYPIGETVINLGIALCIDWCLRNAHGRVGRLLEWRPIAWFGLLSYSLYLWQQPFLNRHAGAAINAFPLNLALALAAAIASYYLIEKPSLRLRSRLQRRFGGWLTARRASVTPAPRESPLQTDP